MLYERVMWSPGNINLDMGLLGAISWQPEPRVIILIHASLEKIPITRQFQLQTHTQTPLERQCLLLTWASVMCDDICQVSNISPSTAHLASSAVLNIRYSSILCSQDYSSARASAIPLPQQAKTVWHRSDVLSKGSKNIFPKYEFFYLYFLWKTCTWIEN